MKTKSIFVLLLTLLFCFGANPNSTSAMACSCPAEIAASQVASTIVNSLQDICADCGHTTNCCFSHKGIPFTGSITLSQIELQPELPNVAAIAFKISGVCSTELASSGVNKAPPWCQAQTLVSLHQRLLI